MKTLLSIALAAVLAISLAGCGKDAQAPAAPLVFNGKDITGASFAREFALTDHNGKARTLADFKGKLVVLFFGYTQCPDACPTTMAELAGVMKALGPQADQVQVLFITVDPERDTPALLAQYVPNFDKRFLGLWGDATATAKVAQEFRVFYAKAEGAKGNNYLIDHTTGSYVFDRAGKVRLFETRDLGVAQVTQDLRQLLR
ncbi:MAG: SCO family protein [Pseudomonadota bacterium]